MFFTYFVLWSSRKSSFDLALEAEKTGFDRKSIYISWKHVLQADFILLTMNYIFVKTYRLTNTFKREKCLDIGLIDWF